MAGNARGKIKEHLAGCHSNFDWLNHHLQVTITLIDGKKPNLTEALISLQTAVSTLDEQLQKVYAQI